MPHSIESLVARRYEANGSKISPQRIETLKIAIDRGAPDEFLEKICDALRVSRNSTILLPAHPYEELSRGRGWARKGSGSNVEWGERVEGGYYRVGPGSWVVGATDGFNRKRSDRWLVEHLNIGGCLWTIAN